MNRVLNCWHILEPSKEGGYMDPSSPIDLLLGPTVPQHRQVAQTAWKLHSLQSKEDIGGMQLTCKQCTRFTLLAVLLQIIGLVLFVLGFFPVKPALKGFSGIEDLKSACLGSADQMSISVPISVYREESRVHPQYDRLVIMVIDGLPAEFVLGKGNSPPSREKLEAMPFTCSLLSTGRAIGYHAKAAPPTVTMPRLKAMISGAIAGFLDVAFNFNTQALRDDNIIGQLKTAGWQMLMYGDETWLRLLPKSFVRHDGVSSFYVKDTVEVDDNVTRHLDAELRAADWDLLILHYLGLDHVGHLGGRASPLMHLKLMEMDMVIQRVYASLISNSTSSDRRTLLLVASDHGMTDGGNHGGASFQETDAIALFLAEQNFQHFHGTYNNKAFQVDLVPTLALLLGVPIPRNNVGVLLPELFSNLAVVEKLRALELNSWQLMKLLQVRSSKSSCIGSICLSKAQTDVWQGKRDERDLFRLCSLYRMSKELHQRWKQQENCSYKVNQEETGMFGENDGSIKVHWQTVAEKYIQFLKASSSWLARGSSEKNMLFIYLGGVFMLVALAILLWTCFAISKILAQLSWSGSNLGDYLENFIAFGGVCMYLVSFGSSSLIEEEQFTWHFLVITLFFILIRRTFQLRSLQPSHGWNLTLSPFWTLELFCARNKCDQGFNKNKIQTRNKFFTSDKGKSMAQLCGIFIVMIIGRLLQCWHRSGVNWSHLPDIAKWIDQADPAIMVMIRAISMISVTAVSCIAVLEWAPRRFLPRLIAVNMIMAAMLTLLYVLWTDNNAARLSDYRSTLSAQMVYTILGCTALLAFLVSPHLVKQYWIVGMGEAKMNMDQSWKKEYLVCLNFIGRVFISCWCLLQMLLQQSVNTVPFGLLFLQLLAILVFFNNAGSVHSAWLKILTLFWLGASGHYGLGNTNTLATVDVAGAYIGLRSHSIFSSGLLAFMITYASPLLYLLGLPLVTSFLGGNCIHTCERDDCQEKQSEHWLFEVIALPCLVPLALNSLALVGFTVVMLLMQDHLFVWSVFSPKYLYVCANTFCTYAGVIIYVTTGFYTGLVIKKLNLPDSAKCNHVLTCLH